MSGFEGEGRRCEKGDGKEGTIRIGESGCIEM
jgi:hypothetical protein